MQHGHEPDHAIIELNKQASSPVMHCEDEVGRLYWAAIVMMSAVASSAAKPLVGEILARRTPIALQYASFALGCRQYDSA